MEKKINIEMENMVGKTYFKVATWYNEDYIDDKIRQESLKQVCVEIIQQILEDTFLQLDGVSKLGTETIKKEDKPQTKKESPKTNGGMFQINEDAILKGINGLKK